MFTPWRVSKKLSEMKGTWLVRSNVWTSLLLTHILDISSLIALASMYYNFLLTQLLNFLEETQSTQGCKWKLRKLHLPIKQNGIYMYTTGHNFITSVCI